MRKLVRAGASGALLVLLMLGAGLVLWGGNAVAGRYIRSRGQGSGGSVAFSGNLLGRRALKRSTNPEAPGARHRFFGDAEGRRGTLITCLEYPQMKPGEVGIGSTHHFALAVESEAELSAWRDYLVS